MSGMEWERHGLTFPILKLDRPSWMHSHAQAPWAQKMDGHIRIFFSPRQRPDSGNQSISRLAFADFDLQERFELRNISHSPVLELGTRGMFDEFGTYPMSTVEVGSEIWGYYGGWTRTKSVPFNVQIGLAVSLDGGETFERRGRGGPILSFSSEEPFIISGPKIKKFGSRFYLFYIAGRSWITDNGKPEPVYRIRLATSDDGLNWEKLNRDLISPCSGVEAQASPDVFWWNGRYNMLFSHRPGRNFREPGNGYRLGYAWSKDLFTWSRDDEFVNFPILDGEFDTGMQAYPHFFELNNRQFMAYLGNDFGRFGFGIAELKGAS